MNNNSYIVNVEAAIFKEDKWLLGVRSSKEEHAAGSLSLIGGKVEKVENRNNVLEETVKREIEEETGIQVADGMQYVKSSSFVTDLGKHVIDIVFLCQYKSGEPTVRDHNELTGLVWLSLPEVLNNGMASVWTKDSLKIAEQVRLGQHVS